MSRAPKYIGRCSATPAPIAVTPAQKARRSRNAIAGRAPSPPVRTARYTRAPTERFGVLRRSLSAPAEDQAEEAARAFAVPGGAFVDLGEGLLGHGGAQELAQGCPSLADVEHQEAVVR